MAINPPLLALAAGAFGIGVTEFTPMGMLPLIAGDLHVSIPAAGLVVSAYAIGVLVGAPLMTLATARMPRRHEVAEGKNRHQADEQAAAGHPCRGEGHERRTHEHADRISTDNQPRRRDGDMQIPGDERQHPHRCEFRHADPEGAGRQSQKGWVDRHDRISVRSAEARGGIAAESVVPFADQDLCWGITNDAGADRPDRRDGRLRGRRGDGQPLGRRAQARPDTLGG
jgi:hypothetical protein